MIDRRAMIAMGASVAVTGVGQAAAAVPLTPSWSEVEAMYPRGALVNLNNGGLSPVSIRTAAAAEARRQHVNLAPALNIADFGEIRLEVKKRLAAIINCRVDEIALNRNGSEGLCTAIYGMPLQQRDEVVVSRWDYASMLRAWGERARRDRITLRFAEFELPSTAEAISAAYARVIGPMTRAVHVTHMPESNGELFPAERICAAARAVGAITLVDAAHTIGQVVVDCEALGCDMLSTSLHKWLCGPVGTGMLYIRRGFQGRLRPLIASYLEPEVPIDRFDQALGTYDMATEAALLEATELFLAIGSDRYRSRLYERKLRLVELVRDIPGVKLLSPVSQARSGAIVTIAFESLSGRAIRDEMLTSSQVLTRSQNFRSINGVRFSPHIYTRDEEIDRAAQAFRRAVLQVSNKR